MKRPLAMLALLLAVLGPGTLAYPDGQGPPYLKFCGANGTIFGSCHLLFTGRSRILVDCGLFQEEDSEEKDVRRKNEFLPFEPSGINAILVTHAHADHIGKIPYLVKNGFSGKIYCTKATADLAREMLALYAWVLSKEYPLYDQNHVNLTLQHLVPCDYQRTYTLPDGLEFRFLEAGHILGSAMVELNFTWDEKRINLIFTGDIGNPYSPMLRKQDVVEEADYVICESTYGNRAHGDFAEDINLFCEIINETVKNGGKVLIPSYILARTQKILYYLNYIVENKLCPRGFDVFVDSKYANTITKIYRQNFGLLDRETQAAGRMRNPLISFPGLKEQKPPVSLVGPAVIIAPSGMATVGNIRTHLKKYLPDPRSAVVFVGFQADGSLGKLLLDGAKWADIDGDRVPVKAKSYYLSSFSDHADFRQMTEWLKKFKRIGRIILVHGQPDSLLDFKDYIENHTPFEAYVPRFLEKLYLEAKGSPTAGEETAPIRDLAPVP